MPLEKDHSSRLSTVEQRTESLEKSHTEFREQYSRDRTENRENFQRIFSGLETMNRNLATVDASRGRIPVALIVAVIAVIPAVVVPVAGLNWFFVSQTTGPIKTLQMEDHIEIVKIRDQQINMRVEQARIEERQKFILNSYEDTKH